VQRNPKVLDAYLGGVDEPASEGLAEQLA
jgi:hypothetical protein